jgi:hypothetical protein
MRKYLVVLFYILAFDISWFGMILIVLILLVQLSRMVFIKKYFK